MENENTMPFDTEENQNDMSELFNNLDAIIANTDLNNVTSESSGFEELPEGYYLCEVDSAELTTSKSSGQPMVKFQFTVVEEGKTIDEENGETIVLKGTKNRKIFKYYVLKDSPTFKTFVSDALKFEGEEGKPILEKDMLLSSQLINDCLEVLIGMRIWIQCSVRKNKDDTEGRWYSLKSWDVMNKLEM